MILPDTSVWVAHFRIGEAALAALLDANLILAHPFVIGELALGNVSRREAALTALLDLPAAVVATDREVREFIDRHALFGGGVGYVDAHLLAATRLTAGAKLWTHDKKLHRVADAMDLAAKPNARP